MQHLSAASKKRLLMKATYLLNTIEQRRNELTFKFSPDGFLPEEFRKALIRGIKSALNGEVVVGPHSNMQYGSVFDADTTLYMCEYLREAFRGRGFSEAVDDAFSYYSDNIWGIRISDSGFSANVGLPRALGLALDLISSEALYELRRLYYRQMITDLKKEQRAFNRLKRFVQLYEKALTSDSYNKEVESNSSAFLCCSLSLGERMKDFEWLMNSLMYAEAPRGVLRDGRPVLESTFMGLVYRLAQAAGIDIHGNSAAQFAGVEFNYRARHWHQDRLAELKGILHGSHV